MTAALKMGCRVLVCWLWLRAALPALPLAGQDFIRASQVGYKVIDGKIAIAFGTNAISGTFDVCDAAGGAVVWQGASQTVSGSVWGRYTNFAELDFSRFDRPGRYFLRQGGVQSRDFTIAEDAYAALPDELLEFMREQRCGYNPFLDQKCHQLDGRTYGGPMPDGTWLDCTGGWHDAADTLKYLLTSGNATAQMLMAWRLATNTAIFHDAVQASGRPGSNGVPDLLDEARWGLEWMLKLHPAPDLLFHQVADDRDHYGWRLPKDDQADYGWGRGSYRVVYFATGAPLLLGGWAEESVNGSTSTPGFLEQYFGGSYSITINGESTNQLGVLSEYGEFFPTDSGLAVLTTKTSNGSYGSIEVPVIGLYADRNHDGVINTSFSGPDFCSPSRPFQFWVNDDNDSGDTGGDDIPGEPASLGLIPNGVSGMVNGTRDLIDFFPVYVDIEGMLEATNVSYVNLAFRLSQADGALNFIITDLGTNNLLQYLTDTNEASTLANTPVTQITSDGVTLGLDFFNSVNLGNGGVILVEARTNTTAPLVLDILSNGYVLAEAQLPLNITGVEQMFRHVNLTPAVLSQIDGPPNRLTPSDVPNALDDNGTNFLFLHGYNVNPNQARGWESEFYKRLYWSGSHARFYGVTWDGYYSQGYVSTPYVTVHIAITVTANYHTNVANAFLTAPYLAAFINSLDGTNVVAAHSLGNMVVLSALNDYGANIQDYFMIDAAVAMEAIDASAFPTNGMVVSAWSQYTNTLYSAYWHNLFSNTDYRSKLAWPGRFSSFNNAQAYNFYSSGEEVLRSWELDPPTNILTSAGQVFWDFYYSGSPLGSYVWCWQEKAKGIAANNVFLGSDHGGWKFNTNYSSLSLAQADALPPAQLQTNAFFDFGSSDFPNDYAIEGSLGNAYAFVNNNRMLGDAIPALSYAVGANHVTRLAPQGQPDRNVDMQASWENGWASGRGPVQVGAAAAGEWHHSDCREVSYTYTYKLFDSIVTLGNLK